MIFELPISMTRDTLYSFMDTRLRDIKRHVGESPSRYPAYALSVEKRHKALETIPTEYETQIEDLLAEMDTQSYELQLASYLQGLADGSMTLSQLSKSTIIEEVDK